MKDSAFLWLYGIPGSGKTILCSVAIEYVENVCTTGIKYAYLRSVISQFVFSLEPFRPSDPNAASRPEESNGPLCKI